MGYFTAPTNKKPEVAHLLGSIMGFSADDFQKVEGGTSSWLNFVRGNPTSAEHKSTDQAMNYFSFIILQSFSYSQLLNNLFFFWKKNQVQSHLQLSFQSSMTTAGLVAVQRLEVRLQVAQPVVERLPFGLRLHLKCQHLHQRIQQML